MQPIAKCLALDALDMDFNPSRQFSAARRGDRETMALFLAVEEREKLAAAIGEIERWAGQCDLQNERAERVELVNLGGRRFADCLGSEGDLHIPFGPAIAGEKEIPGFKAVWKICLRFRWGRAVESAHHAGHTDLPAARIGDRESLP